MSGLKPAQGLAASLQGQWPLRPGFWRQGLALMGRVGLAAGAAAAVTAALVVAVRPRDPVGVILLGAFLWSTLGFWWAYKRTARQLDVVGPRTLAVRLYADRLEVDQRDGAPWVFPRPGLAVESGWFQGLAGDRVDGTRGYTATILVRVAAGEHAVVFVGDGDIRPVYQSRIPRWEVLEGRWPAEPRRRLAPAHLVALAAHLLQ
ncbi:MAG: hypothetical protein KC613_20015 [Myxococcales bacterium]|nr:hypothetical protein [Myxococcales bacterium]MCB9524743.1 hypothetical protein [Myxococcales bacterium]